MSRLKIAVVTPEFPSREWPHRGRPIYQLTRRLQQHANVQVICPVPRYPRWLRPTFDFRPVDLTYCPPEVSARYFEFAAIPGLSRAVNGLVCAHRLEPHIQELEPDVILNFWLYPAGFAAAAVGHKLGIPAIVGSIGSDLNAIADPLTRWLTRKTLRMAARVITKSEQLRRQALAMGAEEKTLHVVPNGCDTTIFFPQERDSARAALGLPADAELISFVGRMDTAKGVHELLDAFLLLTQRRPKLRLVYVGDGPQLVAIRRKATISSMSERVLFPGACSPHEVSRWLAAASLLALPSYAEGCPNAILEALSCGRPVVATNVGGIPDLVDRRCGLLVPPHQTGELAQALDSALDCQWDETAIASHYRRSWEQVAQEVLAICDAARRSAGRVPR